MLACKRLFLLLLIMYSTVRLCKSTIQTTNTQKTTAKAANTTQGQVEEVPLWAILLTLCLLLTCVCCFIFVFFFPDKDGNSRLPCISFNPEDALVGHVRMRERKLGRLEKGHSERSLTQDIETHKISVATEDERAIYNHDSHMSVHPSHQVEFGSTFDTHEITRADSGRCAHPERHQPAVGQTNKLN